MCEKSHDMIAMLTSPILPDLLYTVRSVKGMIHYVGLDPRPIAFFGHCFNGLHEVVVVLAKLLLQGLLMELASSREGLVVDQQPVLSLRHELEDRLAVGVLRQGVRKLSGATYPTKLGSRLLRLLR